MISFWFSSWAVLWISPFILSISSSEGKEGRKGRTFLSSAFGSRAIEGRPLGGSTELGIRSLEFGLLITSSSLLLDRHLNLDLRFPHQSHARILIYLLLLFWDFVETATHLESLKCWGTWAGNPKVGQQGSIWRNMEPPGDDPLQGSRSGSKRNGRVGKVRDFEYSQCCATSPYI